MTLKKLPIGIQTFSSIREEDYLYIDKTPIIEQLVNQAGRYFLSRPRRFGKSLLLDTIKELFEGNKPLFEGLYIYDKWDWDKRYPVIRIDFAAGRIQSELELNDRLQETLDDHQQKFAITCKKTDAVSCFSELIIKAHEKFGQKVVILIDEYDKPILDNILNLTIADEIREGLKSFYSVMKAQDAHIQFILMTGVSKFSKVSLFSGVNQIVDITLDERYATICGYTQHDLETTFADHLAGVDWAKLKAWYNGYNFLGDSVYNPYDVLLFIDKNKDYRSYWAETGGTSFLFKLFRENPFFIPDLDNIEADEQLLSSFDINHIKAETLLFQTGYLTIDSRRINFNEETIYKLKTPNKEVSIALHDQFIESYCDPEIARYKKRQQETLYYILMKGDLPALEQELKRLFASIPWKNFTNSRLPDYEGYYASVIYAFFATMKMPRITAEDITNHGQADITFEIDGVIYIIEIKVDTTKSYRKKKINPALKQIQDRGYRQKYIGLGMPVFEIGMIFNQTVRNLVQMDWVRVNLNEG